MAHKLLLNTLPYQLEPSMFSLSATAVKYWNGYFRALTYKNTSNFPLCAAELEALLSSTQTPMAVRALAYRLLGHITPHQYIAKDLIVESLKLCVLMVDVEPTWRVLLLKTTNELMLEYLTIEEKIEAEELHLRELSDEDEEETLMLDDLNLELDDVKVRIEDAEREYPRDLDVEDFLLVGLGYKDASEVDLDELDDHNLNFLRVCCEVVGETGFEEEDDMSEMASEEVDMEVDMEVDDGMKMTTSGIEGYVSDWNEECPSLVGFEKH